jgi:hypothetical protein
MTDRPMLPGSGSEPAPPTSVAALAREVGQIMDWTDRAAGETDLRVLALEEIIAARWPRSVLLRRRLRRDLRASVRHTVHGHGFRERRVESLASGWLSVMSR